MPEEREKPEEIQRASIDLARLDLGPRPLRQPTPEEIREYADKLLGSQYRVSQYCSSRKSSGDCFLNSHLI